MKNTNDKESNSLFEQLKLHYQSRHAPPITRIEENEGARLATTTVAVISLIILAFILWASVTPIEEIAVTAGEVIPRSKVYSVQHLEGGVIGKILVKDGDEVQKNQVLVIFDPTIPKLELEQIRARNASLIASSQYLSGLLENEQKFEASHHENAGSNNKPQGSIQSMDPSSNRSSDQSSQTINQNAYQSNSQILDPNTSQNIVTNISDPARDNTNSNLDNQTSTSQISSGSATSNSVVAPIRSAADSHYAENRLNASKMIEGGEVVAKFKQEVNKDLAKFESILDILKKRLALLVQEKDMYETLLKTGAVSKKDYLELLRTITQVQEDISKTQAARVETQYAINKLEDRINRIDVRSPIHGLVKGLQTHVGNVIAPGGVLMEIVPVEDLMVETKIRVADIGHIKMGAPVRIKVAAYDYTRYGVINGKLVNISATTFMDAIGTTPNPAPYYKALIELDKSYVGDNQNRNRLLPGMTVQADINTGSKSLLQYLLRPVEVLISSSFREY